jgi:hypothetical protein
MDMDVRPRQAIEAAIVRLLRPLVRVLLRHGMPFGAFEELAKRVYVDTALHDFALEGKKPSMARASILTGLTRKEVQRLVTAASDANAPATEHYNRATRVMTGWVRDPDFLTASGEPMPLALEGEHGFAALAKRHSGDMPTRAVLDELLRVGSVRQRDDGLIEPVARAYVPHHSAIEKIGILGADVADLIDTIDHNLHADAADARFQRKVMYHRIRVEALPAFRKLSATQAQALLERLDRWLADHDVEPSSAKPGDPHARVGMGIYYFEERLSAPASDTERGST